MHRIDSPSKDVDLFGVGKHGYTEGDPSTGDPATQTTDDHLNAFQEEIAGVVEDQGLILDKLDNTQLLTAIKLIMGDELVLGNWFEQANPKNFSINGISSGFKFGASENFDHPVIVAVGGPDGVDAYLIVSHDGRTWAEVANPKNFDLNDVAHDPVARVFVAVGQPDGVDAYIASSTDPENTWFERSNPLNSGLNAVRHNGAGLWVAVGNTDGTRAYIITSPDGVTWAQRFPAVDVNESLRGLAFGGGLWVAGGTDTGGASGAYIITSPDGITWTQRTAPDNGVIFHIEYDIIRNQFIAVGQGDSGESDATIYTSPDGINWTRRANPRDITLLGVAVGEGLYVAVGSTTNNQAYMTTSVDGIQWTDRINPKLFSLQDIHYTGGVFITAGNADGTDAYMLNSLRKH